MRCDEKIKGKTRSSWVPFPAGATNKNIIYDMYLLE
jgi:hypothetical protein